MSPWQGWLPWLIVSAIVIVWTHFKWSAIGQQAIPWPGLHNAISITLYNGKPYAAIWTFQPLGTRHRDPRRLRHHRAGRAPRAGRILRLHRQDDPPDLARGR